MMRELAELGMRMARAVTVGAEMRAQAGEATAADEAASSLALQRAAKTVRLTVALDKKLHEAARPRPVAEGQRREIDADEVRRQMAAAEASADAVWVIRSLWKLVGKPMIQNSVELVIETETEGADRERLLADLREQLVEREEELIAMGPGQYEDILREILKGMGLAGRRLGASFAQALAGQVARAANDPGVARERVHPPP
jgi:hypothetical protein